MAKDERRVMEDERGDLHECRPGRAFDEFHFIAVRRVDKEKTAARGRARGTVGNPDAVGFQAPDGFVQVFDLEGQVDQIFLYGHRSACGKAAQLDEFVAVGDFEKRQMRSTRRCFAFQDLQSQHSLVEVDGVIHVADAHARV